MAQKEISTFSYCIEERECLCRGCGQRFTSRGPADYELVCFESEDGRQFYLPTYTRLGYLDLLNRLVPEANAADNVITPEVVGVFEQRLQAITPTKVRLAGLPRCPGCGSKNAAVEKRTTLLNPPVERLKINTVPLVAEAISELTSKYADSFNWRIPDSGKAFEDELKKELGAEHELSGASLRAAAVCESRDDALFALDTGWTGESYCLFHLTWSGKEERTLRCIRFNSLDAAVKHIEHTYLEEFPD